MENEYNDYIEIYDREYTKQEYELHTSDILNSIELFGKNKKVKVTVTDSDVIKCKLTYMKEFKDCDVVPKIDNNKFYIDYNYGKISDIEIIIEIPNYVYENVIIKNENASVLINGIKGGNVDISTKNGVIDFEGTFSKLNLSSSNGEINCKVNDFANEINDANIATSNGCININVPSKENMGYKIHISNSTTYNSNHDFTTPLKLIENNDSIERCYYTENYYNSVCKCDFNVSTSNGYITLD